jgi:hypothetical protein
LVRLELLALLLLPGQSLWAQRMPAAQNLMGRWTGTWATAMQVPVKSFMPYNNDMSNRSVRQVIKVSAGGDIVRLQLSNIFSSEPVEIRSVYIAHALDSFRIDTESVEYLRFDGHQRVVIAPGKSVWSDAERFALKPLGRLAITINYKSAPKSPTVHMGSRTTSYILRGYSGPQTDFSKAFRYEKWFNIAALNVYAKDVRTFAILGNSITDGKGSTTDHQNRWPDEMSFNLYELGNRQLKEGLPRRQFGVLNLGIGNNRVLSVGYGLAAKDRFDRGHPGTGGCHRRHHLRGHQTTWALRTTAWARPVTRGAIQADDCQMPPRPPAGVPGYAAADARLGLLYAWSRGGPPLCQRVGQDTEGGRRLPRLRQAPPGSCQPTGPPARMAPRRLPASQCPRLQTNGSLCRRILPL